MNRAVFLFLVHLSNLNSHPPESNRRPTDYESSDGRHKNQQDPSISNDFSNLGIWSLGLFGSLGKFSDTVRTLNYSSPLIAPQKATGKFLWFLKPTNNIHNGAERCNLLL